MIVNISPSKEMFDESQHVLNFSAIAKNIKIHKNEVVQVNKNNRFSLLLHKNHTETSLIDDIDEDDVQNLKNTIANLQMLLEEQRNEMETNFQTDKDYIIQVGR